MIKSFTDLEQSKKLAEILPLESADMCINSTNPYMIFTEVRPMEFFDDEHDPAWSLAALYNILPNTEHISTTLSRGGWIIEQPEYVDKWWCEYENENDHTRDITVTADDPVDACYNMILKLNELNLL